MKSCLSIEVRRARPLIGTFVHIAARGSDLAAVGRAVDAAFTSVTQVHRLMSFHELESDVSRLNREAFSKPVRVHPWTWHVLKAAQEFSRNSDGVFDITVGRQLVRWNYLPKHHAAPAGIGSWRDIIIEGPCQVRFRKRLVIDLGGIAKGFAVDRAVKTLKRQGVTTGIVNAGGDLRVFGPGSQFIHLRRPATPTRMAGAVKLSQRAMATSGTYFERRKYRGKGVTPLVCQPAGRPGRARISVTVAAAECMIADALTKVVFALREKAATLLARYHADALLLERDGAPFWTFHAACERSRHI